MVKHIYNPTQEVVQDAILDQFKKYMPERTSDIEDMFDDNCLEFILQPDIPREKSDSPALLGKEVSESEKFFVMESGLFKRIQYNNRALRVFWLATFIAHFGNKWFKGNYNKNSTEYDNLVSLLDAFKRLCVEKSPDAFWPGNIPEAGLYASVEHLECWEKMAIDRAHLAANWAMLHEIKHIIIQRKGCKLAKHEEELLCDKFAANFMLKKCNDQKIRDEREIGILLGLFAITLLKDGNWNESDSHPSIQKRIDSITELFTQNTETAIGSGLLAVIGAFISFACISPGAPCPFKRAFTAHLFHRNHRLKS